MDFQTIAHILIVAGAAIASRWPFRRFPMDEDFATWTYRARFAAQGLRWKHDMFCFYPTWRMHLLDALYGSDPTRGFLRIRDALTVMHAIGSAIIYLWVFNFTGSGLSSLAASLMYAFFATAPSLSNESFNWEQIYVPLLLLGFYLYHTGQGPLTVSGLCFGFAVLAKVSTGIFIPPMMALTAWQMGSQDMAVFSACAIAPVIVSHCIEWRMGYLDAESRRQFSLRLAVTLRCSRLKRMYGSIRNDLLLVLKQTLPLWVGGIPGAILCAAKPEASGFLVYGATTLVMIVCQRGFSRYHYFPLMAVLAVASGVGVDWAWRGGHSIPGAVMLLVAAWATARNLPFYFHPLSARQLARYEKFDQFIYVPYLGKILNRLLARRKGDRLFVWGNYVQLYHLTGKAASDRFVHYALGPWDEPILADYFDTVIGGMTRHKPRYLVKAFPDLDMERLKALTGLDYRLVKSVLGRFPVYRLAEQKAPERDPLSMSPEEKLKWMDALTQGWHAPRVSRLDESHGRFRKALAEFRKLTRLNPADVHGWFARAESCERLGKYDEAIFSWNQLIGLEPDNEDHRVRLAGELVTCGKLEEAKSWLREEEERFGKSGSVIYQSGRIFMAEGRPEKAVECFAEVLRLHPDWLECRLNLATFSAERGELKLARDHFEELWEKSGQRDWLRTQAALGLADCDASRRSRSETLRNFLQRDPKNEPLAYALASALEKEGLEEEARKRFKEAAESFQQEHIRASAWFRLARLVPPDERERCLRNCLVLNPAHEAARRMSEELTMESCRVQI